MIEIFSKLMALIDRISSAHKTIYRNIAKDLGLTSLEVRVIGLLKYLNRPVNLTYLSESLYMRKPTVVEVLDKLERKGIIERKRCQKDKRAIMVSLSDKGRKLGETIESRLAPVKSILKSIDPDLLESAFQFSFEYLYLLRSFNLIPVLRTCYTCANFLKDEVNGKTRYICKVTGKPVTYRDMNLDCPLYKREEGKMNEPTNTTA